MKQKPTKRETYDERKRRLGIDVATVVPVASFFTSYAMPCHSKGHETLAPEPWQVRKSQREAAR